MLLLTKSNNRLAWFVDGNVDGRLVVLSKKKKTNPTSQHKKKKKKKEYTG